MTSMDVDSGVGQEVRKSELKAAIGVAEHQLQNAKNKLTEMTRAGFTPTEELSEKKRFEVLLSFREMYKKAFDEAKLQALEGNDLLVFLEDRCGDGISRQKPINEQIGYYYDDLVKVEAEIELLESQGYVARSAEQREYDDLPSLITFLQNHKTLLEKELDAL